MTPSELKREVERTGHERFFFTRDTMRFFGDKMSNYGVRDGGQLPYYYDHNGNNYNPTPRMIAVWELYRRKPVNRGLIGSAFFDKKSFRQIFPSKD